MSDDTAAGKAAEKQRKAAEKDAREKDAREKAKGNGNEGP